MIVISNYLLFLQCKDVSSPRESPMALLAANVFSNVANVSLLFKIKCPKNRGNQKSVPYDDK